MRAGIFLVPRGEHVAVDAEQLVAVVVTECLHHLLTQPVRPADYDLGYLRLDFVNADAGPLVGGHTHDGVQSRKRGVGDLHARVNGDAFE